MMMVTVWVFIGIEGASVYSKRANKRSDVGKATIIGFVFVLAILIAVNLLSLGIMQRSDVANLPDVSTADVLAHAVGPWGAWFISIGVILSLLGLCSLGFYSVARPCRFPVQTVRCPLSSASSTSMMLPQMLCGLPTSSPRLF